MKVSKEMKWTFCLGWLLFIVGLCVSDQIMVVTSVIIFVILSATIEILKAIHSTKEGK